MASGLYFALYASERALDINLDYQREVTAQREVVDIKLATGRAWQEDSLALDLELAELVRARLDLDATHQVLVAQLDELLHRDAALPLPPTPLELAIPELPAAPLDQLVSAALRQRPELAALAARRDRATLSADLAEREDHPGFKVMGSYSSMWPRIEHQIMVGVAFTLPVWRDRRHAAIDQAEADGQVVDARRAAAIDRIRGEVIRAVDRCQAAIAIARSYRDDILPTARQRVEALRLGLTTGRSSYLEMLRAERTLSAASLAYQQAIADAHRYLSELDGATGQLTLALDHGDQP
jgi:cobalt-zinc-cadmium efflux system outer membrane protein